MYPMTAAAAIETMTEADRWERFAALEAERFARYGVEPAEPGLPWGPDPEEAAAAAALMDEVESAWDYLEAFGDAAEEFDMPIREPEEWELAEAGSAWGGHEG